MPLKTGDEYIASVEALDLEANVLGRHSGDLTGHDLIRPSLRAVALTYDCAHDDETRTLFRAHSPLTGGEVNRFTHLHQSTQDLVDKIKMQRVLGQCTACCFQRCVGMDSFNALDVVTYNMDQELGTHYNQRFRKYLTHVQEVNLVIDGAIRADTL